MGGDINVNGMRGQSANVTIDGIDANQMSGGNASTNWFHLNPDNIQSASKQTDLHASRTDPCTPKPT